MKKNRKGRMQRQSWYEKAAAVGLCVLMFVRMFVLDAGMNVSAEKGSEGRSASVTGGASSVSGGDGTVSGGNGSVSGGDGTVSGGDAGAHVVRIEPMDPRVTFGDGVIFQAFIENADDIDDLEMIVFQWNKDGQPLDGADSQMLEIDSVLDSDAGIYSCDILINPAKPDAVIRGSSVLSVSEAVPEVSLSVSPISGSIYGSEGIVLTAEVSHPTNGAAPKPEGKVEFFVDGVSEGTAELSEGKAFLESVVLTSEIIHQIYAKYSGESDARYGEGISAELSYEVGRIMPQKGVHYERNIADGDDGWYKAGAGLEIKPLGVFDQIREGESGAWKDKLTKWSETSAAEESVTFYLRSSVSGEISYPQTETYRLDSMPPQNGSATPKIVIDEESGAGRREWEREYLGDVNGGGKRNKDNFLYHVTLTAEDSLSGVAYFQWKYKNDSDWGEPVAAVAGEAQIGVAYGRWYENGGIVFRGSDGAGNLSGEFVVPAQNALAVTYDIANLKRCMDKNGEDILEEDTSEEAVLIYSQPVDVILAADADAFDPDQIEVYVNNALVAVNWEQKDASCYRGVLNLAEGDSSVEISAQNYGILSNETGSRVVWEEYASNIHVVDITCPVVQLTFEPESSPVEGTENIFNSDRCLTVSITEKNFRPDGLRVSGAASEDAQGDLADGFDAVGFLERLRAAEWKTEGLVHSAQIFFSEEAYYSFTLEYKDLADNPAAPCVVAPFKVDKNAPEELRISYVSDPIGTFQQEVTFGYYNPSVTVQLSAEDFVSGVKHFDWMYVQEEGAAADKNVALVSGRISAADSEHFAYVDDGKTAVATFTLSADEFAQYRGNIAFTATDIAGHTSVVHLGDGLAKDENGNLYDTSQKHVVIVDTVAPIRELMYLEPQRIRERDTFVLFEGNKMERANRENSNSILYYDGTYGDVIPVVLKIREANFYPEDVDVKVNDTYYKIDDWIRNGDEWIGMVRLTEDGTYRITVDYTDRSGNIMPPYRSEQIVIDRVRPSVVKYEFLPATVEGVTDTAAFVEGLEYGYYFSRDFVLNIHISDGVASSGVDIMEYRLVSYENGIIKEEAKGISEVKDGIAELLIPAGFKGRIYVQSCDKAGNVSLEVSPRAFVVDTMAPIIDVVNNDTAKYADGAGNHLFTADTSVTATITDTVSGIREIGYAQGSEINGFDRREIVLENVGYSVGDNLGDGWMVSAMDANLVTSVTKTFLYDSDNNDVILSFDATDRSGNKREGVVSEKFTVDKTVPIIHIAFREDDDTDIYYETNRIADITVIERNFDVSLIHVEIENAFGNVPEVVFTKISDVEYRAVINFDEGDYTFEVSGKDLGGHIATVDYSGGNENLFRVDKTRPIIIENFGELDSGATENNFNQDKTISVSITEHNFSPELVALRIFRKSAGSEHRATDMEDVTAELIRGRNWDDDGDVHSISFTISEDAVYRIEMFPIDLAGNEADFRSSEIFEIDKTPPVISARDGWFVGAGDTEFLDVYDYNRKDDPMPTVEFSDLNISYIRYSLTVWMPDYSDSKSALMIRPVKAYREEDPQRTGIVYGGKFELPDFTVDGVYALELTAVDAAGNESESNVNTYVRLVEQDVLAYILDSDEERRTGLYSFQYVDGKPISMRPNSFCDLKIFAVARRDTEVEIVLRDANGEEIDVNAQMTVDQSVYGLTFYDFEVKADFFQKCFSDDTDKDLYLTVKNEGKRIDLGRIHIDNIAPTCVMPEDFRSWHWYPGEKVRSITLSNISEQLDEKRCKVYDKGEEIGFEYSAREGMLTFWLGPGWHDVGIILCDEAGNINNVQEKVNIHVGYFWMQVMFFGVLILVGAAVLAALWRRKRMRALAYN